MCDHYPKEAVQQLLLVIIPFFWVFIKFTYHFI